MLLLKSTACPRPKRNQRQTPRKRRRPEQSAASDIRPPHLIGPCVHTIRNQDLTVPFEGFEGWALTGRSFLNAERPSLGRGGLFSFHTLSGQGVRGMGWPTQPVRESYGRIKRPQLVI
jgi:hypothetical protein